MRFFLLMLCWLLMGTTCIHRGQDQQGAISCKCSEEEQSFEFGLGQQQQSKEVKR